MTTIARTFDPHRSALIIAALLMGLHAAARAQNTPSPRTVGAAATPAGTLAPLEWTPLLSRQPAKYRGAVTEEAFRAGQVVRIDEARTLLVVRVEADGRIEEQELAAPDTLAGRLIAVAWDGADIVVLAATPEADRHGQATPISPGAESRGEAPPPPRVLPDVALRVRRCQNDWCWSAPTALGGNAGDAPYQIVWAQQAWYAFVSDGRVLRLARAQNAWTLAAAAPGQGTFHRVASAGDDLGYVAGTDTEVQVFRATRSGLAPLGPALNITRYSWQDPRFVFDGKTTRVVNTLDPHDVHVFRGRTHTAKALPTQPGDVAYRFQFNDHGKMTLWWGEARVRPAGQSAMPRLAVVDEHARLAVADTLPKETWGWQPQFAWQAGDRICTAFQKQDKTLCYDRARNRWAWLAYGKGPALENLNGCKALGTLADGSVLASCWVSRFIEGISCDACKCGYCLGQCGHGYVDTPERSLWRVALPKPAP